jgi:hypothetical protein
MDFKIKKFIIKIIFALIFWYVYVGLFLVSMCGCLSQACADNKIHGLFFCNACACYSPINVFIEGVVFGLIPFIIIFVIISLVTRK